MAMDTRNYQYRFSPGQKSDEALLSMNQKLSQCIKMYQAVFIDFIKEMGLDENAERNCGVALYLATYFDVDNKSSKVYVS
jgi:hypothetical protein